MLDRVVFVAYCRKNSDSRGFLFLLQWPDFDDKDFAENERNFDLKKDCYHEKVFMEKILGKEDAVIFLWLTFTFLSAVAFLLPPDNFRGQYFDCHCQIMAQRYSKDLQIPYSLSIARVASYFLHTSYGLIFICESRVTF